MRKSQSGNAVVFVLLAIALFAGLAYTFMRGAKSGQGNLTAGQARINAQDVVNYAQSVEAGVNKLMQRGCSEQQLNFETTPTDGFQNSFSPSDKSCHLFDSAGANITPPTIYTGKWNYNSRNTVTGFGCGASGFACTELLVLLTNLDLATCMAINQLIDNRTSAPPAEANTQINEFTKFNGVYSRDDVLGGTDIDNKSGYCIQADDRLTPGIQVAYHFYHILLVR